MKNTKVGILKKLKKIPDHVTALISEQFSESKSDHKFCAKLGKCVLQEPHCIKLCCVVLCCVELYCIVVYIVYEGK